MCLTNFIRTVGKLNMYLLAPILFLFLNCNPARANDIDDAQEIAIKFLDKIGNSQFKSAWEDDISQWFKKRMTKEAFLANMTVARAQLGGTGSGRELVQRNTANIPPGDEITGPIFSFMFSSTYPAARIYESVALVKEDGEFKITGFNYVPNPN